VEKRRRERRRGAEGERAGGQAAPLTCKMYWRSLAAWRSLTEVSCDPVAISVPARTSPTEGGGWGLPVTAGSACSTAGFISFHHARKGVASQGNIPRFPRGVSERHSHHPPPPSSEVRPGATVHSYHPSPSSVIAHGCADHRR